MRPRLSRIRDKLIYEAYIRLILDWCGPRKADGTLDKRFAINRATCGGAGGGGTHSRYFTTAKFDSTPLCEMRGPAAYGSGESLPGAEALQAASSN